MYSISKSIKIASKRVINLFLFLKQFDNNIQIKVKPN